MQSSVPPKISVIVAMSENRVIGLDNQIPWRFPADLKHFKQLTTGNPILMGRKTFESIGRPLPNRTNIIITRAKNYKAENCMIVSSLDEAITRASSANQQEIFIIGGAEVYTQFLPRTDRIYLTIIHHHYAGDTFFPELNPAEWEESVRVKNLPDAENPYAYSFITLNRKKIL